MKNLFFSALFLSFANMLPGNAQLTLPGIFSNHMVLQRDTLVSIWGWAQPNQTVYVAAEWIATELSAKSGDDGNWKVELPWGSACGPYRLTISCDTERIVLQDIFIGEVWLCSGQSNMVWGAAFGHQEMLDELPHAENSEIRLFNVQRKESSIPLNDLGESWQPCDSSSSRNFSAIGYFMAKRLHAELKVPVGIIFSAAGSTTAELWIPPHIFKSEPTLLSLTNNYFPAGHYWNAMLNPLAGYALAGVCWYQGESNVVSYEGYDALMRQLILAWRTIWGKDLPFYMVQIAPFAYESQGVHGNKAAFLREQQIKCLSIDKTGLVVTTDLVPNVLEIHPPKKRAISERLVNMALAEVYAVLMTDYKSPVYDRYEILNNKIRLHFNYLQNGLMFKEGVPTTLFIAGNDRKFFEAVAEIEENMLVLHADQVRNPVAVRYGFTDTAQASLFNLNGLPVAPFRTDNWQIP